jgi:hypothetical protein
VEDKKSSRRSETGSVARSSQNGDLHLKSVTGSTDGRDSVPSSYNKEEYERILRENIGSDFEEKKRVFDEYKEFLKKFIHQVSTGCYVVELVDNKDSLFEETNKIFSDPKLTSFMLQILFPNPESSIDKYLGLFLRAHGIKSSYSRKKFYYNIALSQKELKTSISQKNIREILRPNFEDVFMIQTSALMSIFK